MFAQWDKEHEAMVGTWFAGGSHTALRGLQLLFTLTWLAVATISALVRFPHRPGRVGSG